jgi:tetratricopeptide (TPR) repeat protein
MSVEIPSSRLILSSLNRRAGFYQQLLRNGSTFQELGNRLIRQAEVSIAFRHIEAVEEVGLLLSNFSSEEYRLIGHFYQAWCAYRKGDKSRTLLENVLEKSQPGRPRALLSLAAIETGNGNVADGVKLYNEAAKYSANPSTLVTAARSIAVIKSIEGSHKQALKELESLFYLARYASSHVYFDYLNSLAVELAEVGRLEEARNISNIVLASPYVFAYPEWRETREDIERKGYHSSRSFVPITQGIQGVTQDNIVRLPERDYTPVSQAEPARILHYDWKNRMVKEPNGNQTDDSSLELDKLTNKDLIIEIVQRASNKDMSEKKLRKILEYVMEVESEPEN